MNIQRKHRKFVPPGICVLLCLFVLSVTVDTQDNESQNYQVLSSVVSASGGQGTSANYGVQSTTGQPAPTGFSQSENFGVFGGFQSTTLEEFPEWVPHARLSTDVLDFGEVSVGNSKVLVVTIYNDGLGVLEIGDMYGPADLITIGYFESEIGGLSSVDMTVTYSPTDESVMDDILLLECNDESNPDILIYLYGVGVGGCQGEIGDVNGDAAINVLDVLAVVNDILGLVPLDEFQICRADCKPDGLINVLDALNIVNIILGVLPECPPENAKPIVTEETIAFLEGLRPHFPPGRFEEFMAMVKEVQIPETFSLSQNYPNPFNPETTIEYTLSEPVRVRVEVYNLLGQVVDVLVDSEMDAGFHVAKWNAVNTPSGVYYYRLTAGDYSETRSMVLMK